MKKQTSEKEKRIKILAIVCTAISIILIIIGLIISIFNGNMGVEKDEMTIYLEKMGKEFYEDFYYEQLGNTIEEKSSFLSQYREMGIKISLETISKYKENKNKDLKSIFVNKETNEVCNFNTIRVIIYPKEPYKKESYKMVIKVDC